MTPPREMPALNASETMRIALRSKWTDANGSIFVDLIHLAPGIPGATIRPRHAPMFEPDLAPGVSPATAAPIASKRVYFT